jgi:LEM3 (ligand-effect modulator 3) family / CDC50 family
MDSDSESDRAVNAPAKTKSRRPPNTAFRQQRLKAWQPILTPKTVLPLFFCVAIIFAPIGGLLLYASDQVQEISIDYSNCASAPTSFEDIPSQYVSQSFKTKSTQAPLWKQEPVPAGSISDFRCVLQFDIPNDIGPPVYMFYKLTNFYQNHRRYVQSFDEDQINGKVVSAASLNSNGDCKPLIVNDDGIPIYPCGLIANSRFNDTFYSPVLLNSQSNQQNVTYEMTSQGIAWSTDQNRFKKTQYNYTQVVPPPNWYKQYPDGYTESNPIPDISQDEDLQNWMRTAGLPTFAKLKLRNDTGVMTSGTYQVDIDYNFPVLSYDGTKSLLITTRTVIGGKNPFLGIAYLVVAGLCFVLGVVFLIKHLVKPRKLGDHSYLSWNSDGGAEATVSGREQPGLVHRR